MSTLVVFDIDDTLFITKACVNVMRNGELVSKLSSSEYNTYTLSEGEEYVYDEFRCSDLFHDTSEPIEEIFELFRMYVAQKDTKVIINTARGDFNDKDKFLETFRKHDVDIDQVHVERSGNLELGSSAKNKKYIFHKYLRSGKYDHVIFYDDSIRNIVSFSALKKKYPKIKFEAYHVDSTGSHYLY